MTAITAFDMGSTILPRIRQSPAPSIFAASRIAGSIAMKKLRTISTLNAETAGRISAQ